MDEWAAGVGFHAFGSDVQLAFLRNKESELNKLSKKRRAEEEATQDWIRKKRWLTEHPVFPVEGTSKEAVAVGGVRCTVPVAQRAHVGGMSRIV